jgi:hypothetical protein
LGSALALVDLEPQGHSTMSSQINSFERKACYLNDDSLHIFDLTDLEQDQDYTVQLSDGSTLTYQFCAYVEDTDTFAQIKTKNGQTISLTDDDAEPTQISSIKNAEGDSEGVKVFRSSPYYCPGSETEHYSFTTNVMCAQTNTAYTATVDEDDCAVEITVQSPAGCAVLDTQLDGLVAFLKVNDWILAVAMLIGGPVIAFRGKQWFPYAIAGIAVLSGITGTMILGYLLGMLGSWITGTITFIVGCIASALIAKGIVEKIDWAIGGCGFILGAFAGEFIDVLVAVLFGYDSKWFYATLVVLGALIGFLGTYYHGRIIV